LRPSSTAAPEAHKLTELQASTLDVLSNAEKPIGAYEILRRVEAALKRDLKPMTIYRVIDHLDRAGLVTRIESLGGYVSNPDPGRSSAHIYFWCTHCRQTSTVETAAVEKLITKGAATLGFKVGRMVVECPGICAECLPVDRLPKTGDAAKASRAG
jgi:Fur family transcriptional regulator, zinc uptake regulator